MAVGLCRMVKRVEMRLKMELLTKFRIAILRGEKVHEKDAFRRHTEYFIILLRFKAAAERRQ